jgi:hypothetical protein
VIGRPSSTDLLGSTDNHDPADPAFCQANGHDVVFGRPSGQAATVTVTNVLPAAAQVVTPRFTG